MEAAAKEEGEVISYGMSDDWVNLGNIWKAIEDKYQVVHTDTDMTSAEQIVRLEAEKNARLWMLPTSATTSWEPA